MSIERPIDVPANDNEPARIWTQNGAIAEIGVLRDQAMQEGAADFEPEALTRLIIDVRNAVLAPAEAVAKAHALVRSRQSYH